MPPLSKKCDQKKKNHGDYFLSCFDDHILKLYGKKNSKNDRYVYYFSHKNKSISIRTECDENSTYRKRADWLSSFR